MEKTLERSLKELPVEVWDVDRISREVYQRLSKISNTADSSEPEPVRKNGYSELMVPIGISIRHVHLCQEHVEILFGKGHNLVVYSELYQKGYFAAKEQVVVAGPKRCLEKVRVLGPTRPYSQVELSQSDALLIGLRLPIAIEGSDPACKPVTLIGPEGVVSLPGGGKGGAYIARRHIHLNDRTAAKLGLKPGDLVDLYVDGIRSTTLHDIVVRIKEGWLTEVHVDADEGNAIGIRSGQTGTLIITHPPKNRSN